MVKKNNPTAPLESKPTTILDSEELAKLESVATVAQRWNMSDDAIYKRIKRRNLGQPTVYHFGWTLRVNPQRLLRDFTLPSPTVAPPTPPKADDAELPLPKASLVPDQGKPSRRKGK